VPNAVQSVASVDSHVVHVAIIKLLGESSSTSELGLLMRLPGQARPHLMLGLVGEREKEREREREREIKRERERKREREKCVKRNVHVIMGPDKRGTNWTGC
jgi:hypothetical protein